MNASERVTVIIPTWNGKDLLRDCLISLRSQTYGLFGVLVVDNGSDDGTDKLMRDEFSQYDFLELGENQGFATAVNVGVAATESRYICLLNNDTEAENDWLEALVDTLEKHSRYAGVTGKMRNYFARDMIDGTGDIINEVGQAQSRGFGERDRGQYDEVEEIFGITGGASLIRRDVWKAVGPFEERFFAYFEDTDWCLRARLQGYQFVYQPAAIVYHRHKATSSKCPEKLAYLTFRNTTLTYMSNFPSGVIVKRWRWLKIILVHLNTVWYLVRSGLGNVALKADLWIFRHIFWLWRRRRRIQSARTQEAENLETWLVPKKISFWGLLS